MAIYDFLGNFGKVLVARNPDVPDDIYDALGDKVFSIEPVGSRVTCNPPPIDTDEDYLVLLRNPAVDELIAAGYNQDGSPEFYTGNDAGGFQSWRKGDVNIITTESQEFYNRFMSATYLAKRFNLTEKKDRIALFQVVLYNVHPNSIEGM